MCLEKMDILVVTVVNLQIERIVGMFRDGKS